MNLPYLLVTMIKTENSQPHWLPRVVAFLCKLLYPKQSNEALTNTDVDSFIYIPCGLGESAECDYQPVIE